MFSVKDARFKQEGFVAEVKEFYTGLINRYISDPEQQLKVFDPQSVYLPTKKIGRNNPKAEEIKADNAARQEWNRTADMALLTGISEAEILEVKQAEIHEKVRQSIHQPGGSRTCSGHRGQGQGLPARADPPAGNAAEAHAGH